MKRDWDLIRTILFKAEENPPPQTLNASAFPDVNPNVLFRHIELMNEAGLVKASIQKTHSGNLWILSDLTWDGHEFLDKIRSDTVWKHTKEDILKKGSGLSMDLIKAVASSLLLKMIVSSV